MCIVPTPSNEFNTNNRTIYINNDELYSDSDLDMIDDDSEDLCWSE